MGELISFGVLSDSSTLSPQLAQLGNVLTRRLDRPVTVVPAVSYTELADRLADGHVDFAWLPPIEAAHLTDYTGVHLLLQAVRHGERGEYHSVIFVRDDSPITAPEQLNGARMAYVHHRSASGYVVAAAHLVELGVETATPPLFLGSHAAVVQAVAEGRAKAGATFGTVGVPDDVLAVENAGWQEFPPSPRRPMRVVTWAGPVPPDAICAWPGTSRLLRNSVVEVFLAAADDAADATAFRAVFGTGRFGLPDRGRYERLNGSLATLRRARRSDDPAGEAS